MTVYNPDLLWLAGFTGGGIFLVLIGLFLASALGVGRGVVHRPRLVTRLTEVQVTPLRVQAERVDQVEAA